MKNLIAIIFFSFLGANAFAQQEEEMKPVTENVRNDEPKKGFKKENLFVGGGVQLSFSNYDFIIGGSPVIGYSINKWVDVGVGLNFTYISERLVDIYGYTTGDKIHQTDIAPVAFARFYPVKFLFLQAQGEQNFISQKFIDRNGGPNVKEKFDATSLLLGVGYANGREGIGDFYYYLSISIDVLKKPVFTVCSTGIEWRCKHFAHI